jgi:hypothetical protein
MGKYSLAQKVGSDSINSTHIRKFGIRDFYTPEMAGLHLALFQHSILLHKYVPRVAKHFSNHGVSATMYASQWFLTLFSYSLPLEVTFRILDLLFTEGAHVTLMRVSISLLKRNQKVLLQCLDLESILTQLKGLNLIKVYGENHELLIHDVVEVSDLISLDCLETLKRRYVAEDGNFASKVAERELEIMQEQIEALKLRLEETESKIASLKQSNSEMTILNEDLQIELSNLRREKDALELEANILKGMITVPQMIPII